MNLLIHLKVRTRIDNVKISSVDNVFEIDIGRLFLYFFIREAFELFFVLD